MNPMERACQLGELGVCKWLHDHGGAAPDITRLSGRADTPMFWSASWGHLPVCQWLFEVGASADISTVDRAGCTPHGQVRAAAAQLLAQWARWA